MKVIAFVASFRKKHSHQSAVFILRKLSEKMDLKSEIINLHDFNLGICRGCKLCCDRGEELCPLKDDRDVLIDKIRSSDGVIFISPNYTFQVSGMMKMFLDRLAFICHRPEFFGKTFTSIVPQGIFGGGKIVKYLDFIGKAMGFKHVAGSCITTLEPMTVKQEEKNKWILSRHADRFLKELRKKKNPAPGLFDVVIFRISRTKIQYMLDEEFRDYTYYRDKGWFSDNFFYAARLGLLKKAAGRIADSLSKP
ncbi:MAG: NAD(P)H-dependent oxidoreductase [Deltaproteobacteria bacterium]|nr:NAD(P)H-dependent oxidoreductase [Deltaproteobacteria bacterium]